MNKYRVSKHNQKRRVYRNSAIQYARESRRHEKEYNGDLEEGHSSETISAITTGCGRSVCSSHMGIADEEVVIPEA